MSANGEAWIAQRREHCMDCYRPIVPVERYHETGRGPVCYGDVQCELRETLT